VTRVWIDGELFEPADARVAYDDHGMTVGDGVFETVRLAAGRPFALRRHLDRLARSIQALRLPAVDLGLLRGAAEAVAAEHGDDGFLRITVTAGRGPLGSPRADVAPTVMVAVRPGRLREHPADVHVVPYPRNERGALAGVKSTSYAENVVALADAADAGAEEALFGNCAGNLCEGTGSNVFVVLDDWLVTPPLSAGCLAGVTRDLLLDVLGDAAVEADVPMARLVDVSEMFLVSTAREVQPVRAVDGRLLPGCPGPHTVAARTAWVAEFGRPGSPIDP
jgi:branched-chain amino acid aminotransferase